MNLLLKQVLLVCVCLFALTGQAIADPLSDAQHAYDTGNYAKAVTLYRSLAEQGIAIAQFKLGLMYGKGQGIQQDYKEAVKWYQLAAEQGNADAQYSLGIMHAVIQDYREAIKWFRLSAEQGNAGAQYYFGLMYAHGQGIPQDYKEALKWYQLAAGQGNADAQYKLGVEYAMGRMVSQDYIRAYMWIDIAAANNRDSEKQETFTDLRNLVSRLMAASQITEAQERARECTVNKFKECY